jgi:hypothetical protein
MMDGSNENHSIGLKREYITQENIVSLFQKYNVPSHFHLLSVDIDYNDFYCLKEILANYKIDVLICEYNSTHLPNEDKVIVYDPNKSWDGTNYFGASLLSLNKLATKYDYTLVYCNNNGVNCFFIHNSIIQNKNISFKDMGNVEKIYKTPKYGCGPNGGHYQDNQNRPFVTSDSFL